MSRKLPKRGLPPMHPGELLREEILPALVRSKARSKTEIARLLGVSRQTLYVILSEEQPVTAAMALRLGKLCESGPDLWLNLQKRYDLHHAQQELGEMIKRISTLQVAGRRGCASPPDFAVGQFVDPRRRPRRQFNSRVGASLWRLEFGRRKPLIDLRGGPQLSRLSLQRFARLAVGKFFGVGPSLFRQPMPLLLDGCPAHGSLADILRHGFNACKNCEAGRGVPTPERQPCLNLMSGSRHRVYAAGITARIVANTGD
jgi:antitoxin HigA-1